MIDKNSWFKSIIPLSIFCEQ